jgi:2,5-diamino-6-(ribosylamino)-4(3H)-pyrimidinone 5'-phosphate reductase
MAPDSELPFIFVNMAMTADGKIATANRMVSSFSSKRDFEQLLRLRATADAVMSGARTANSDNVNLGPGPARFRRMRLRNGLAEYNLRVIVSGSGSIHPGADIFRRRFSPIIILTRGRIRRRKLEPLRGLADEVKAFGEEHIDFRKAFHWLRKKWGVKRLLCEGGGELNGALFRAGLVRELHLTICPKIFGGDKAPTIADGQGATKLARAARFRLKSIQRVADELFLAYEVLD